MAETTNPAAFEELVAWACSTLPEKIRELPDFPGIQIADEPPAEVMKNRKLFSGICRTQRSFGLLQGAPDLIFVFRGPILRCSKGDLWAEVKQVVWHEVAHWLGHDEKEVEDLGLSSPSPRMGNAAHQPPEGMAKTVLQPGLRDNLAEPGEAKGQQPRCLRCYSADVTCRKLDKPASYSGAWLSDPVPVHATICKCNSCGYEWDDENNT
jgi:predicted Zn-dependent protease with MMP-like domain